MFRLSSRSKTDHFKACFIVASPATQMLYDILVCYDPSFMKIKYFVQLSDIFARKSTDI